jgi:hypothetical protein
MREKERLGERKRLRSTDRLAKLQCARVWFMVGDKLGHMPLSLVGPSRGWKSSSRIHVLG